MRSEQQPRFQEDEQKTTYAVDGPDRKKKEIDRDDIIQEAALILEKDPEFPDARGERADLLRAKRAIREALKSRGNYFSHELESQIGGDAGAVLDLFKCDRKK